MSIEKKKRQSKTMEEGKAVESVFCTLASIVAVLLKLFFFTSRVLAQFIFDLVVQYPCSLALLVATVARSPPC